MGKRGRAARHRPGAGTKQKGEIDLTSYTGTKRKGKMDRASAGTKHKTGKTRLLSEIGAGRCAQIPRQCSSRTSWFYELNKRVRKRYLANVNTSGKPHYIRLETSHGTVAVHGRFNNIRLYCHYRYRRRALAATTISGVLHILLLSLQANTFWTTLLSRQRSQL